MNFTQSVHLDGKAEELVHLWCTPLLRLCSPGTVCNTSFMFILHFIASLCIITTTSVQLSSASIMVGLKQANCWATAGKHLSWRLMPTSSHWCAGEVSELLRWGSHIVNINETSCYRRFRWSLLFSQSPHFIDSVVLWYWSLASVCLWEIGQ